MKRQKKQTPAERLMTALYVTHYNEIKSVLERMINSQADDIISLLGERLLRTIHLWDGNDATVKNFLITAARRLAINHLRNGKRFFHECDLLAAVQGNSEEGGKGPTELRAFRDSSEAADARVIDAIEREELRAAVLRSCENTGKTGGLDRALRMAVCDGMLSGGIGGTEFAQAHGYNINTVHGVIKRIREIAYEQKRLGRISGA